MTAQKPLRLRMAGAVTLPDAARLAAQLADLPTDRPVEIDATALEQTDAAVLQVLVAAGREAQRHGSVLRLHLRPESHPARLAEDLALGPFLASPPCIDDALTE